MAHFGLRLFFVLAVSAPVAAPWIQLNNVDGIAAYSDGASPPTFRAEGILHADIVDVIAIFSDVPRRVEWVAHLKESRVIRDNGADHVVVYSRYHLPWPASDRDSVLATSYAKNFSTRELTMQFKAIDAPDVPPREGVIRLPQVDGILYLKALKEGATMVRYEVKLDHGGWLPAWICNYFVRDAPAELLRALRRRIAETRSLYQGFRETERHLWHGAAPADTGVQSQPSH